MAEVAQKQPSPVVAAPKAQAVKVARQHKYIDKREVNGHTEYLYPGETWPEKDRIAAQDRVKEKRKKRVEEAGNGRVSKEDITNAPKLTPIEQEAVKFNSAEEFISSMTPIYHGSNRDVSGGFRVLDERYKAGILWGTDNKEYALEQGNVENMFIIGKEKLDPQILNNLPKDRIREAISKEAGREISVDDFNNNMLPAIERSLTKYIDGEISSENIFEGMGDIRIIKNLGFDYEVITNPYDKSGITTFTKIFNENAVRTTKQLYNDWAQAQLNSVTINKKIEEHKSIEDKINKVPDIDKGEKLILQGNVEEHEVQYLAGVNNLRADLAKDSGRISDKKYRELYERIVAKVNKVSDRLFNNIKDKYSEFWEYAEENAIYYHGTNEVFDTFKNTSGAGVYFTTDRTHAESFANEPKLNNEGKTHVLMKVALNIKNPAPQAKVAEAYAKASGGNPVKMAIDDLRAQGYDGIIRHSEIVVFDTNQIFTEKQLKEVWDAAKSTPEPTHGLRQDQPRLGFNMRDTVARERFNISKLKKLSFGGSDRDVYIIPKKGTVTPLETEALTHKTAESFINSQTFLHGSVEPVKTINVTPDTKYPGDIIQGFYITKNTDYATKFSQGSGNVEQYYIDPDAKILDFGGIVAQKVLGQAREGRSEEYNKKYPKPTKPFPFQDSFNKFVLSKHPSIFTDSLNPSSSSWDPKVSSKYLEEYIKDNNFDVVSFKNESIVKNASSISKSSHMLEDVWKRAKQDEGGAVLKIAKSPRGMDQNAYSSDYNAEDSGLIPKTVEVGKNYIVKERVDKPDKNTRAMVKELSALSFYDGRSAAYDTQDKARGILNSYVEGLGGDFANYDLLWGDMQAIRNWGTKDGKPILLDEGTLNGGLIENAHKGPALTNPEFRDVYNQSKAFKKQFGDSDKKTMY